MGVDKTLLLYYIKHVIKRESKDMFYKKMICEELDVNIDIAEKIMNKMSIGGFRFSSSSKETIIEEATFINTYCM